MLILGWPYFFYLVRVLVCLFLFLATVSVQSLAQKFTDQKIDSVRVKGRSILILGDSSIYVENDTVFVLPDSIASQIRRDEVKRSEDFYQRLKERFYRTRVTKRLYDLLFVDPPTSEKKQDKKINAVREAANYQNFEGKRISNIVIKKLRVFGTNIQDTSVLRENWATKIGNKVHIYTKDRVIRNNIFFEEGDEINPELLSDSERVLRSLPFIKDARIYVTQSDSVDTEVLILVRDVWSISPLLDYGSVSRFNVGIRDRNFFGQGHEIRNELIYGDVYEPSFGYAGDYIINNIYNTFITGQFTYARSDPYDRLGIHFYRKFITPETKYAGGVEFMRERQSMERHYLSPDTTIEFDVKYNSQNYWLGRSFALDQKEDGSRLSLQVAGRYAHTRHLDRPGVREDTNQLYFDKDLYLFSVGINSRNYEKSTLINGFGRTEDIPIGYLLEFTTGLENNEFYKRHYLGGRMSMGTYVGKLGYVRPSLSMGGFIHDSEVEQAVITTGLFYFSNLYRFRRYNFRQFFRINYTLGLDRFNNEYVNINDTEGIRGYSYRFLRGTKKLTLSSETVAFTPYYFLGFRFAFYLFADLALVNNDHAKLLKNVIYQGYGIGVRLRNENLAFNTVQIRIGWYPVSTPDNAHFMAELTGNTSLGLSDFQVEQPSPIEFR